MLIMPERYVISVSKTLHKKIGEEADKLKMHRKDYVQSALVFFTSRKINPTTYNPGKEFDLIQLVKQSTEQILNKKESGNRASSDQFIEEIIRGRLLQEVQLNILIEKLIEPELREKLHKDVIDYVENNMRNIKDL